MADEILYNDPANGSESSIGPQMNDFFYQKRALIEARKEIYFMPLADVTSMPKHMGKKIKKYHYLPLLDDANINDQGIDANAVSTVKEISIQVTLADGTIPRIPVARSVGDQKYFVGEGATAAAAEDALVLSVVQWCEAAVSGGGLGLTLVGGDNDLKFADAVNSTDGLAYVLGYRFDGHEAVASLADLAVAAAGNMYGSSKDVGTITNKLPHVGERGGRVNRVGFTRIQLEGEITKLGFFDEFSKESLDFDTDPELKMHINREMISGAHQISEAALQIDLLNGAGIVRFGGVATSTAEISGIAGEESLITYLDLQRLSIDLTNNNTPKKTTRITGSRNTDTKTMNSARYIHIGSELEIQVKSMVDTFGNQAFVSVEKYAAAGNIANGEIGQIDQFKFIVVPEMLHWAGAGKAVGTNAGYRETGGNYDVYPMLVIGDASFTTIGFQTNGKSVKFVIKHVAPESDIAYSVDNPFGEIGFMSIKWWYGTMILRPERIALVKCVAQW